MAISTTTLYQYLTVLNLLFKLCANVVEFSRFRKLAVIIEKRSLADVGFASECEASRREKAKRQNAKTA